MASTIDAFENGDGPQWRWLRINESLCVDDERGIHLWRRSKRSWEVYFTAELEHDGHVGFPEGGVDHGRPSLSIYKHKPKDQPQGPYLLKAERENFSPEGKVSYGQLKPAVLAAMKMLVLMDVVPRLTGG